MRKIRILSGKIHEIDKIRWVGRAEMHYNQDTHPCTAAAKSLQSCPTLCDPMDGSPPGSPVPGILLARTLEWVAIAFSVIELTHRELSL